MAQTVFDSPTAVGAKILTVTATVTNTSGAYTNTITDERITTAMKAIEIELGDPSVFGANITVTCNNGSITISCPDVEGTSTVSIDVIKTVDDPTSVTSIEFDVLNSRINKVKEIINDVAEYSDESTYSAGDRVWYSGKLYKANQDIDIAEDWDSTHWDQEDIMDDIDDIRDSIPDIADNLTTNDATKTLSAKQGKVLNDSQAAIQDAIAIVATGDTHPAIASGQFVYVKGHSTLAEGLYRASAAIAANASLTSSNLTADTDGGLNAVKSDIPAVVNNLTSDSTTSALSAAQGKALNNKIPTVVDNLTTNDGTKALSAKQGKTLNDKIKSLDNTYASVDAVKNALLAKTQNMVIGEQQYFQAVQTGDTSIMVKNKRYAGAIKVEFKNASALHFVWDAMSADGVDLQVCYANGTWSIKSIFYRYEGRVLPDHSNLLDAPLGTWSYLASNGLTNTPCTNGIARVYDSVGTGWKLIYVNDPTDATKTYVNIKTGSGWGGWKKYTGAAV